MCFLPACTQRWLPRLPVRRSDSCPDPKHLRRLKLWHTWQKWLPSLRTLSPESGAARQSLLFSVALRLLCHTSDRLSTGTPAVTGSLTVLLLICGCVCRAICRAICAYTPNRELRAEQGCRLQFTLAVRADFRLTGLSHPPRTLPLAGPPEENAVAGRHHWRGHGRTECPAMPH